MAFFMNRWISLGVLGASFVCLTACESDSNSSFSPMGGTSSGGSSASGGSSGSSTGGRGGNGGSGGSVSTGGGGGSANEGGMTTGGSSGNTAAGAGAGGPPDMGEGGAGGTPDEDPGKGGKGDGGAPPEPDEDCPVDPPPAMTACDGMIECLYRGLRCTCMGRGDDARFECRGSGDACPSEAPEHESTCENSQGVPNLECPYPDGTECRCMGDSWRCNTRPEGPMPPM